MHYVIQASNIPMSKRLPHLHNYLGQVRRALMDPSLSPRRRARLQAQLERLQADIRAHASAED